MDHKEEELSITVPKKSLNSYHLITKPSLSNSAWLETRLFYVRITPCVISSVPDHLTLRHVRRDIGVSLEINGSRVPASSDSASLTLRLDRVNKESSEVTYVSTDTVRVTGGLDLEVWEKEGMMMLLCGSLERMEGTAWGIEERAGWSMECFMASGIGAGNSAFFQPKLGVLSPSIEVYVAGCCGGVPVILTKTIQVSPRRKVSRHGMLDAIPEDDGDDEVRKDHKAAASGLIRQRKLQITEAEVDDYDSDGKIGNSYYSEDMYYGEDGQLSWFNAGVRVGVGIGLGMCLGIGIGVGLLMRSYQATTRNFRRRFICELSATMPHRDNPTPNPFVVTLNCIEDCVLEQESLAGIAEVEHVPLSRLSDGKIESAAAVLLHSLAFLPRAAQRRLRPYQLILCLGSADRSVDSALAADLGLRLVHVDTSRAEEIADTVMALVLGLLRRTHLLSRHALSASGWLGSLQPLCRGMRRCRGLVLGIVGRSPSARSLASRSLAFRMSVLYFDVHKGKGKVTFPSAARRMDTLNDLLAASDLVSLHCDLTNETIQIINAECLQHLKPGAFLINTGSSQLLDDCALKQLLIDGTLAGCALDGAEGPQWMEAWVREMPNVLILPRSADYSEEVWLEIRDKAISILQTYFLDGVVPKIAVSDEDEEESELIDENENENEHDEQDKEIALQGSVGNRLTDDIQIGAESSKKKGASQSKESSSQHHGAGLSQTSAPKSDGRRSRSGKKAKKRHARQKSLQKSDNPALERESTSHREDDTAMSGTDQVLSSSSRFASPEDSRSRKTPIEAMQESTSVQLLKSSKRLSGKSGDLLKDGYVIALYARDRPALHVSRQRVKGGGWFLDTMSNVTKRDPAAQFLFVCRGKDTIGLRSFAAGGKLLQINRRMEFVFASHSFDVWESWTLEGPLEECRLVNCRNPLAVLEVHIEILAAVGEDDGVTRWLD
ncbi:LOW QUALITY PROTEIN: 2-Hacid_dh_C domain-containing protein [Cephalotus follicularis]|uniref:2-Hacid_dh_C domain-containing protein n=1 Tax=Cephalotus follicularis TaxID=3775 RepID=A0A1Q3CT38_CEPFO|nr:LOW QUALITY PROTEIN: 2-Hacid_dh_C domain-containing protein [Cephalotus follicularis]